MADNSSVFRCTVVREAVSALRSEGLFETR